MSLRQAVVDLGRCMYERGYISGTEGNLSTRLPEGRILITPSGVAKGRLCVDDLVVTDSDGAVLSGGRPSSEIQVHLAAYRLRPEVGAVIHAHPKAVVAHSLAGVSLEPAVIPETVLILGTIAAAAYEMPGSSSLAAVMEEVLRGHEVIIMERHGTLTLGRDILQAYHRLESLEHTAQTLYMARTLGAVEPLSSEEVERLWALVKRSEIASAADSGSCAAEDLSDEDRHTLVELVETLVRRVLKRLQG
jgi:L-fuculose-phosphate aldolase